MKNRIVPVILCGGAGSRLWPLSRELYPKQILSLTGEDTLLQETLKRLPATPDVTTPWIVCNEQHRFLITDQLEDAGIRAQGIILEPVARNTAPAVMLSALAASQDADSILLVLPADHLLKDVAAFHTAVTNGFRAAIEGKLVTFGVIPDRPETGYGYIRAAGKPNGVAAVAVAEFVEKPDAATAERYLESGRYLWNSGMFMFSAARYREELSRYAPDIAGVCENAWHAAAHDLGFIRPPGSIFESCRADSVDYAVMEKTTDAAVVSLDAGWSDVGSWEALADITESDADGNVLHGDVLAEDTRDCFLYAGSRLLATVGMAGHIVVETDDAVLVMPKSRAQDVKSIVTRLKQSERSEALLHRQVHRPWGNYRGTDHGERFQVKRLHVKPGGRLSLQMHHHRAEHWVVVQGTAKVTRGDDVFTLTVNESTYIPAGTRHRLENPGATPLEVIEVQTGSYLGEDDIVRFDDVYGRTGNNGDESGHSK